MIKFVQAVINFTYRNISFSRDEICKDHRRDNNKEGIRSEKYENLITSKLKNENKSILRTNQGKA
jgi:hypothetical protein